MPCPTSIGVFGMTRTTGNPAGILASSRAVGTPAASETSTWSRPPTLSSALPSCTSTPSTSPGLTAITSRSAPTAPSVISPVTLTPNRLAITSARSACVSTTTRSLASRPDSSSPAINASPIRPPPITAILVMALKASRGQESSALLGEQGELPALRDHRAGAVEHELVAVEHALADFVGGGDHAQPAGGGPASQIGGHLHGGRPAEVAEVHRHRRADVGGHHGEVGGHLGIAAIALEGAD